MASRCYFKKDDSYTAQLISYEHPNAKDYGFTNEVDYIISCIGNDGRYIWNVMKDWLDNC